MKKALPIIIVVVVLAGVAVALAGKHNTKSNTSSYGSSTMPMGSKSQSTTSQATDKVSISNYSFSPASITVKKGTTVTWTNHDSVAHTVVEVDGKDGPQSQDISNGQSYSFTYNTVGTFSYHCSIHPEMTGTVTVTE